MVMLAEGYRNLLGYVSNHSVLAVWRALNALPLGADVVEFGTPDPMAAHLCASAMIGTVNRETETLSVHGLLRDAFNVRRLEPWRANLALERLLEMDRGVTVFTQIIEQAHKVTDSEHAAVLRAAAILAIRVYHQQTEPIMPPEATLRTTLGRLIAVLEQHIRTAPAPVQDAAFGLWLIPHVFNDDLKRLDLEYAHLNQGRSKFAQVLPEARNKRLHVNRKGIKDRLVAWKGTTAGTVLETFGLVGQAHYEGRFAHWIEGIREAARAIDRPTITVVPTLPFGADVPGIIKQITGLRVQTLDLVRHISGKRSDFVLRLETP